MERIRSMNTLVIDTFTDRTTAGLVRDGELIVEKFHDDPLGHSEVLPKLVAQILQAESQIDEVVIGMGPGPFTGLRAGISFGRAFAFARNIPWRGVHSLDAIALTVEKVNFIATIDARRKELFYSHYANGQRVDGPHVALKLVVEEMGIPIVSGNPSALALARLSGNVTEPIYIRRPDAYPAPKGITFRALTVMDAVALHALEKIIYTGEDPWSLAQFKEELTGSDRYYIAAIADGEVIGYAGIMVAGDVCDILTLSVLASHRRKGIAREMLKRLIDWARNKKVEAIMLEMRIGNAEAEPLYISQGFRKIAERADYYGPGKPATIMRKELR